MVIRVSGEDQNRRQKGTVTVLVCLEYFTPRLQNMHNYPQRLPLRADQSPALWGVALSPLMYLWSHRPWHQWMIFCLDFLLHVSACNGKLPCSAHFENFAWETWFPHEWVRQPTFYFSRLDEKHRVFSLGWVYTQRVCMLREISSQCTFPLCFFFSLSSRFGGKHCVFSWDKLPCYAWSGRWTHGDCRVM